MKPRARIVVTAALAFALARPAAPQQLQEAIERPLETAITADVQSDRGDGVWWQSRIKPPATAEYVRLHIRNVVTPPEAAFRLVVRDSNERAVVNYSAEQLQRTTDFYTNVVFSPAVTLQVETSKGESAKGVRFEVDRIVYAIDLQGRLTPQSILPVWRSMDRLPTASPLLPYADSIAKLYMGDGAVCTAFLINDRVLLTNQHCISHSTDFRRRASGASTGPCADVVAQFDFNNQARPDIATQVGCETVLASDEPMDYAVLQLQNDVAARRSSKRRPLVLSSEATRPREGLLTVHHPAGLATQFSLNCSTYAGSSANEILHDCSTTGGSSGAPILMEDGQVVALHFEGAFSEDMTIGQINRMLAEGKTFLNKARPIAVLRDRLKPFLKDGDHHP